MNKDLLEITINLAYAGMSAHVRTQLSMIQQSQVDFANIEYANTCHTIAKQILETAKASSSTKSTAMSVENPYPFYKTQ